MYRTIVNTQTGIVEQVELTGEEIAVANEQNAAWLVQTTPTYQALRAAAYPPVGDQLDAMWKGGDEQAAMHETILAVKAEYPKTADAS